ncbi:MAG: ABC transporter ATP-binding protein [Acidobacteria bacterium]|nr:MAG: ABC transporter ATP-binding protein [Acidobacteriota bacterium]REK01490.1 MAG: ABC transporter ATP-binding protein [Acidobacteriota bacterium]REK14446.1 MAG: ABC transporter ATP-binding protein [Acidobacteriota bacterium]REK45161.1 MAG: ABC transporter ATP-binding protein [Acidobacteriota bacterium]
MTTAIKIENLSKAYQLGQIGTGTISRDIERWFVTRVLGREDPFLKLGEVNDRATKGETGVVWSLRDINLDIEQGDVVGIIGQNGAGKSTLLKLLSRVTAPTTGQIKLRGRVASLLEVGTGFHQELTGRENIYLNGSILGMRKREIDRKVDEIVNFSGIERYIDTPVKRYSSGMYVRLAFAVAAHLESEILIVDEVLAVGDAAFQKKCIGKMEEVGKRDGRTVLFVSHNMSSVHSLCKRGILLDNGNMAFDGPVKECVAEYSKQSVLEDAAEHLKEVGSRSVRISGVKVNGELSSMVGLGEGFDVTVRIQAAGLKDPVLFLIVENMTGQQVIHDRVAGRDIGLEFVDGSRKLRLKVPELWLSPGVYSLYFKMISFDGPNAGRSESERILLEVEGKSTNSVRSVLLPNIGWSVEDPNGNRNKGIDERTPRDHSFQS